MNLIKKNITEISNGIIAHGTNCNGGFGSGVAGAIAKKWPLVKKEYLNKIYESSKLSVPRADLLGTRQLVQISNTLYIANCFSQLLYGYDGQRYADINAIFISLEYVIKDSLYLNLPLYTVQIGCKLGGLDWKNEVKPIYNLLEQKYNIEFTVCYI